MAASEEFVQEKIKEAEERWKEVLREETKQAKKELGKIKEEIEEIKAHRSSSEAWKDKMSQVNRYKDKFALRQKEANNEKPTIKLNDDNFTEFKQQITGWMKALHPMLKTVIENLEMVENRTLDEEDIKQGLIQEMRKQAEEKYNIKIQEATER